MGANGADGADGPDGAIGTNATDRRRRRITTRNVRTNTPTAAIMTQRGVLGVCLCVCGVQEVFVEYRKGNSTSSPQPQQQHQQQEQEQQLARGRVVRVVKRLVVLTFCVVQCVLR